MSDQPRSRHIPKEEVAKLLEESRSRCCLCRVLIDPERVNLNPVVLPPLPFLEGPGVDDLEEGEKKKPVQKPGTKPRVLERRYPFESEMVFIPGGEFLMGSDPQQDRDANRDEQPKPALYLPNYYMAKTPVTNAQYAAYIEATGCAPPNHWLDGRPSNGKENHSVVNVSWHDALAYCRWLLGVTGKSYSLPSEAE